MVIVESITVFERRLDAYGGTRDSKVVDVRKSMVIITERMTGGGGMARSSPPNLKLTTV